MLESDSLRPIEDAKIVAREVGSQQPARIVYTGKNGSEELLLKPGRYELEVTKAGFQGQCLRITVEDRLVDKEVMLAQGSGLDRRRC